MADASHQLRTPDRTAAAAGEPGGDDAAAAADDLQAAAAETGRLARLVDGLLTLARAEAAPGRREVIDLATVVADRQVAGRPGRRAGRRAHRRTGLGGPCLGSEGRRGAGAGQPARQRPPRRPRRQPGRLAIRQVGGWVELHVIDQGPGMSAEQRERAFDRFWRGSVTDSEGTGLGLAIVRQLLRPAAAPPSCVPTRAAAGRRRPPPTRRPSRHRPQQASATTHRPPIEQPG